MVGIKTIAGGVAVAGALLGFGAGVASADPSVTAPQITSTTQDVNNVPAPAPSPSPSPYAIYGSGSLCGTPGMYFVNICT